MELYKWAKADKVLTIRVSQQEYNALTAQAQKQSIGHYRRKTISDLARDMIRYCLINEPKDL